MRLKDYLRLEREKPENFAERVGVTIHAVRKWSRGERVPRPATIKKIYQITKGAITSADWLGA